MLDKERLEKLCALSSQDEASREALQRRERRERSVELLTRRELESRLLKAVSEAVKRDMPDYPVGYIGVVAQGYNLSKTMIVRLVKEYPDDHEEAYVPLTFNVLQALSETLGTRSIDVGDKEYTYGCETCDYGSAATVELYIKHPMTWMKR
jgi:hypothetical protein